MAPGSANGRNIAASMLWLCWYLGRLPSDDVQHALPKQKTNSVALPHAEGAATEHAFDIKYRDEEDTESQTSADSDFYGTLA